MTVATMPKTDAQIKADVLSELKWDSAVDETEVGVQVHNGIVTLTGAVGAYAKRIAARAAAHRVFGVLDVVDNLTVKIPLPWRRSDEDIAAAARHALQWDVLVPDGKITSTVSGGAVTLEGAVDTWTQRRDAEWAVHRLTGVKSVTNLIKVNAPTVEPAKVRREIESALARQAEREAKRIEVKIRDGVVTLSGTVRSWVEKHAIERAVEYAPGVRQMVDQTTVNPYV